MRLLAAFERQIEFGYTESAIKKQFAVSQTGRRGARPGAAAVSPRIGRSEMGTVGKYGFSSSKTHWVREVRHNAGL